ncbi:MAG: HopJ type III effector protein [Maricaulaceae bacterium]
MTLSDYIAALSTHPTSFNFTATLEVIDTHYAFTPATFKNGAVENLAGTNSGSCKVFSFALLHKLSPAQTLNMFAEHYQNVLDDPNGNAHANIRAFMQDGFAGLSFDTSALSPRKYQNPT